MSHSTRSIWLFLLTGFSAVIACTEPSSAPLASEPDLRFAKGPASSGPTVTSTLPSDAPRDTTLEVRVNGSGFDKGSKVTFQLDGVVDARVRVNSTRYVK